MLITLGIVFLVLVTTAGLTLVKASRDIEAADDSEIGLVAGFVDGNLQRTRTAVDTFVQPGLASADAWPTAHALRERATTYGVFGLGLVGIAACLLVGYLLLF